MNFSVIGSLFHLVHFYNSLIFNNFFLLVELEGVEPSSKQGTNTLSTCLSPPSVFVSGQDRSHQLRPYLLKLHQRIAACTDYSVYFCASYSLSPQTRLGETSRSSALRTK